MQAVFLPGKAGPSVSRPAWLRIRCPKGADRNSDEEDEEKIEALAGNGGEDSP
jgi:hypothetical protein